MISTLIFQNVKGEHQTINPIKIPSSFLIQLLGTQVVLFCFWREKSNSQPLNTKTRSLINKDRPPNIQTKDVFCIGLTGGGNQGYICSCYSLHVLLYLKNKTLVKGQEKLAQRLISLPLDCLIAPSYYFFFLYSWTPTRSQVLYLEASRLGSRWYSQPNIVARMEAVFPNAVNS